MNGREWNSRYPYRRKIWYNALGVIKFYVKLQTWGCLFTHISSHSCWWPIIEAGLQILNQAMASLAENLYHFIM